MAKNTLILLSQISNKFDVRTALDQDRVIQLAELYEGGIDLPPVKLIKLDNTDPPEYAYIDGRHRGAARDFLGLPDVPAILVDSSMNNEPLELYSMALEANYGGPKPPTREDICHTIQRMLEAGVSRVSIAERLTFLPKGALRAFMADALGKIARRKMTKALDLIASGATLETAAKETGVKPESIRDALNGKKGKWGTNRSNEVEMAVQCKAHISGALKSANASIGKKMEDVLTALNDGDISPDTARDIVKAWADHLKRTVHRIKDWSERVEALATEHNKASAA